MEQITARVLRNVEWKPVYTYSGEPTRSGTPSFSFVTYASDKLPGLTITKERRGVRRFRTTTIYKFNGRRTDSPTQIVRYWNEEVKRLTGSRSAPAGSAESLGRSRRGSGV